MKNIVQDSFSYIRTRRLNRYVPYDEEGIKKVISYSVNKDQPINLVGYWGAGSKKNPDNAEYLFIKQLESLDSNVRKIYNKGLKFHFLLADTHAKINGYDPYTYFKEVEVLLKENNMSFQYMEELSSLLDEEADPPKYFYERAKKHSTINPEVSARRYLAQRKYEGDIIKTNFPNSIFNTFNSPKEREFLPDMPTLYIYSRKGSCESPWFITIP